MTLGSEEKVYWNIGEVGKYGTLYRSEDAIAVLRKEGRNEYILEFTENQNKIDMIALIKVVEGIIKNRNEETVSMHYEPSMNRHVIKSTSITKPRAIADNPQA